MNRNTIYLTILAVIIIGLTLIFAYKIFQPETEAQMLKRALAASVNPCQSGYKTHADSMFVLEIPEADVRVMILCRLCERRLSKAEKVEAYRKAWEFWGTQGIRRPSFDLIEKGIK